MTNTQELNDFYEHATKWVDINEDQLPTEWKLLPHRYLQVSGLVVKLTTVVNDLKLQLKETEAKQFLNYKINGSEGLKANPSDVVCKTLVDTDENVHTIRVEYYRATESLLAADKLLHALEMKERSLKYLTMKFMDANDAF